MMIICMKNSLLGSVLPIFALSVAAISPLSAALVMDDFDENRYGWNAENGIGTWVRTPNTEHILATTPSTNPLVAGGGKYVQVINRTHPTDGTLAPNRSYSIKKRMDSTVIDVRNPHTISFDFRLDSGLTTFTTFNDRLFLAGTSPTSSIDTTDADTWGIGVVGGDDGRGMQALQWYFQNHKKSDQFNGENMHFTGIQIEQGVTYSFIIEVDPASYTYTATISSSTGASATQANLSFRNQNAGALGDLLLFGGRTSSAGEDLRFSMDNIIIVPEASSALLFLAGCSGALLRRRRVA
jgi:hypothetical protein